MPSRETPMIETKRLKIYTASEEQMEEWVAAQSSEALRAAYTEMLNSSRTHPDQWEWYALWMIESGDGAHLGEFCFKGVSEEGITEIGYGIAENRRGCGYGTEAVSALAGWALAQPCVTAVTAETEASNIASQRLLKKAGFMPTGETGEEGPIFARRK